MKQLPQKYVVGKTFTILELGTWSAEAFYPLAIGDFFGWGAESRILLNYPELAALFPLISPVCHSRVSLNDDDYSDYEEMLDVS